MATLLKKVLLKKDLKTLLSAHILKLPLYLATFYMARYTIGNEYTGSFFSWYSYSLFAVHNPLFLVLRPPSLTL